LRRRKLDREMPHDRGLSDDTVAARYTPLAEGEHVQ
jgi:hypothetical protein